MGNHCPERSAECEGSTLLNIMAAHTDGFFTSEPVTSGDLE